jgi:cellulose biosynthesis protein BcsQ
MPTPDLVHLVGAVVSALCLIGGVVWWFLRRHLNNLHREIKTLREKNTKLRDRAEDIRQQLLQSSESVRQYQEDKAELKAKLDVLEEQRDHARAEAVAHKQRLERVEGQVEDLEEQLHERAERHQREVEERDEQVRLVTADRDLQAEQAKQAEAELDQLNKQVEQVIKQDERVWERAVTGPPFLPLSRREVPIIAVLNLKGGVGKTTITANLAGLIARQGKKVLVIDADYQRNLSMLLVSDKDRMMLHLQRRTLQHFLNASSRTLSSLLYAASEITELTRCWIVTNSDARRTPVAFDGPDLEDVGLEDIEMRLMAEWMFRQSGPDVRLRLREALHDHGLKEKGYHYVLIDCPPRLSTACVNALAACDFLLIPVLLDATSARSVPNLLRTLVGLRGPTIFPHLRCLGIVANEVTIRVDKPIAREAEIWKELPVVCRVAWGSYVHLFRTMIPDSGSIAAAAGKVAGDGEGPLLALGDQVINRVFTALLKEINTRIDDESKHLATVSAQPAARGDGG